MTNYIKFNKGNIDKLPNPDKRGARYYHEEIKGLHIEVMPSGQKYYRLAYKMNGYQFWYKIGVYPEMTPAIAVDRGRELKMLVAKGINPQQARLDKRQELTFREFYRTVFLTNKLGKLNYPDVKTVLVRNHSNTKDILKFEKKVDKKIAKLLEVYNAHIHGAPFSRKQMSDITYSDISSFLRTISSPSMVNRLIRELRHIFNHSDLVVNPVKVALTKSISMQFVKPRTVKFKNEEMIKIGQALKQIKEGYLQDNGFYYQPQRVQANVIEILSYEGFRPDEVMRMKWTDIVDNVYKLNSKSGYQERQLTPQTMRIINGLERVSPYIFPSPTNRSEPIKSVRKVWLKVLEIAGLKDYQLKDFRNFYSSRATARFTLFDSSKMTYHASTKVVEKNYSDLDRGELAQKRNALAEEIENLLNGGGKLVNLGKK